MSRETAQRGKPKCFGFAARLLSRVISGVYNDAFFEIGLKVSQYNLLNAIADGEDTRPAELAKYLAMDESTLSRNIARMCARGWLRLQVGDDDRRTHQIAITEKGRALLRKSFPAWQKAQARVAQRIGPEGVSVLRSLANKLRN